MSQKGLGRPPKYTKRSFAIKVEEYLEERKNGRVKGPVTILDFCMYAKIYRDYVAEHELGDGSDKDFSDTIKILKTAAEHSTEYFALIGKINPTMAIFSLKNNFGWKDKSEISGPNNTPIIPLILLPANSRDDTLLDSGYPPIS